MHLNLDLCGVFGYDRAAKMMESEKELRDMLYWLLIGNRELIVVTVYETVTNTKRDCYVRLNITIGPVEEWAQW